MDEIVLSLIETFELERSVPRAGAAAFEVKPHSKTVILIKRRRLFVIPLAALPAIRLLLWLQIRTVSDSAKIENLQNHKPIFENQSSHIPYTYSEKLYLYGT
jgi:hypothetical protein